jgi:GTP1/Obg family GTP-binding protein
MLVEGFTIGKLLALAGAFSSAPTGVVLILWYIDHRKMDRIRHEDMKELHQQREAYQSTLETVLTQYKDDVRKVTHFYESNVDLVENYEKLAGQLTEIIHLNTQVQTQLVEQVKNNMFCPVVREKGPGRQ